MSVSVEEVYSRARELREIFKVLPDEVKLEALKHILASLSTATINVAVKYARSGEVDRGWLSDAYGYAVVSLYILGHYAGDIELERALKGFRAVKTVSKALNEIGKIIYYALRAKGYKGVIREEGGYKVY